MEKREKRRRDGMGKGKKVESSSCCSPHNISGGGGGGGGLRGREAYELRSSAARTRSGLIRVRNASPPSKIPNPRHAPKNLGDSRLQVPLPRPELMENENKESESLSNPPAPPSPFPQQRDNPIPEQANRYSWSPEQTDDPVFPFPLPEPVDIDDFYSFVRGLKTVLLHLSHGGTDVERIKREVGVTDETLRENGVPANLEEYREGRRRLASPYIQACFAKLNETTNQDDDLELLDVLFLGTEMPYGRMFHHMHFRAIRKSKADPGHESPGLYCAVFCPSTSHVIGCVLLQNDCPGDSQGQNSAQCLYSGANSANTTEEVLQHASGGCHKAPREYVGGHKCCYEIGELSPHNDSAMEIQGESFLEMYQKGYNYTSPIQRAEGELDRERVGTRKGKEVFSFS